MVGKIEHIGIAVKDLDAANEVQKALETFLSKSRHFSRDVFEIGGKTTTLLHQISVVFVHSLEETANHFANHQRIRWGSLRFSNSQPQSKKQEEKQRFHAQK